MTMHPQLTVIARDLDACTARMRELTARLDDAAFNARPKSGGWSAAECLEHLNMSTRAYLPLFDAALERARVKAPRQSIRYRRDLLGWFLCRSLEPPAKTKFKTTPTFMPPSSAHEKSRVVGDFEALQVEVARRLDAASGLDIDRVRVPSPFNARLKYSVYSAFCVIPAHQRRHLWQAERVVGGG